MQIQQLKTLVPVKIVLPTKQYPHIMGLLDEVEYPCGNCTQAQGFPVFHTLKDSYLDPISGPGKYHTRLGVYCPDCKTQCTDYGYIQRGIVDLLQIPAGFHKVMRADTPTGGGVHGDDEDEPMLNIPKERVAPKQMRSPVTPAAKAKKARLKSGSKAVHASA